MSFSRHTYRSIANKKIGASVVTSALAVEYDRSLNGIFLTSAMLKDFLDALEATALVKKLKRVILIAGAKQHGIHLGAH